MESDLRHAFHAKDLDGDGVLGVEDLKTATGLNERELDAVFEACQGPGGNKKYLTFEEFASGFRQFPRPSLEIETIEEASVGEEYTLDTERDALGEEVQTVAHILDSEQDFSKLSLGKVAETIRKTGTFPCDEVSGLLEAAGNMLAAQEKQILRLGKDCEVNQEAYTALLRECNGLRHSNRLLTEQIGLLEKELAASAKHSEAQNQRFQATLTQSRHTEQVHEAELADYQAKLAAREALVCKLRSEAISHSSQVDTKEDAPSPQAPKTSKLPVKFLFSPVHTKEVSLAQDTYRHRKHQQLKSWERELEDREQRLLSRELGFEEVLSNRCTQLQREIQMLQEQLIRERIKSEHYKVMARDAYPPQEMLLNTLSDELEEVREPSPIRVRIIPVPVKEERKKRSCWNLFERGCELTS